MHFSNKNLSAESKLWFFRKNYFFFFIFFQIFFFWNFLVIMGLALALITGCFLVGISVFLFRYFKVRHQLNAFHQPRSYPFIGHMAIIKPDPEGFLDQIMGMSMLYPQKPKVCVFWIGILPVVMIYEPELAEKVFCKVPHMNKSFLYDLLRPWLGNGLLTR